MKFLTECKFVMKIPTKQLKKFKNTKLIFLNVNSCFTLGKILIRRRNGQRELCRLPQLYHLALLYNKIQFNTIQNSTVYTVGPLLRGKIAKIVIYDQARVNGGSNLDSPGQRCVLKLEVF